MLPRYKDITELIKKGSTVEAQEKIMELREAALELQEENLALRERVAALEKQLAEKAAMQYEAPFYWSIKNDKRDGPFCQNCFDTKEKKVRLQGDDESDWWKCLACDKGYAGPNYQEPDFAALGAKLNGRYDGY